MLKPEEFDKSKSSINYMRGTVMIFVKKLIPLSLLAFSTSSALAAVSDNQVFIFAEGNYKALFSGTPSSGIAKVGATTYNYRYYPTSKNYLAVANNKVYLLGPASNNAIAEVGSVADFENQITGWQAKQPASTCDTNSVPAGMSYSQTGNTINVTTNGCIAQPTGSMCNSFSPQATGVNVVLTVNAASMSLTGFNFKDPAIANMMNSTLNSQMASGINNAKSCIQNAPSGFTNTTVNMDVCFDVTSQMTGANMAGISSYVTIAPPVTMKMKGNTSFQVVPDCKTAAGVTSIYDAYAMQAQFKQADGSWKTLQADGSYK